MSGWGSCTDPCTWGGFVAHAAKYGVTVETLESVKYADGTTLSATYLRREVKGEPALTYAMPKDCTSERPIGPWRYMQACDRLRIPEPDWPYVL
jgi:hypothetical protein